MSKIKDQINLKSNNMMKRERCPICDELHKTSSSPYWFFLKDQENGICQSCAEYYVPVALEAVRKLNKCKIKGD